MVCKNIVKFVLVALNFVILLVGAAMGIIGGLIRWGNDAILDILYDWMRLLWDPGNFTSVDHGLNMMPIVNTIGIVLFVIGLVIFAIGAAGFFGTLFTVKLLLKIYTGIKVQYILMNYISYVFYYYAFIMYISTYILRYYQNTIIFFKYINLY